MAKGKINFERKFSEFRLREGAAGAVNFGFACGWEAESEKRAYAVIVFPKECRPVSDTEAAILTALLTDKERAFTMKQPRQFSADEDYYFDRKDTPTGDELANYLCERFPAFAAAKAAAAVA